MPAAPSIQALLLDPSTAAGLSLSQWDLLIRQGRAANLLARLAESLSQRGGSTTVPPAARLHLESALRIAERQDIALRWELACIADALDGNCERVALLKGAAYAALGLPFAATRIFSDVDILVPHADLARVETALLIHGWHFNDISPHDQRYYRRWMHELPPLHHRQRGTTLDVHHGLLPPTARLSLDRAALFEHWVDLPAFPGLCVLPPTSMLLHSAIHLFHEGEFGNGLRDLFDLDGLIRHFGPRSGFWHALLDHSARLGAGRPLFYALRMTTQVLATPVPDDVMRDRRLAPPAWPLALGMQHLYAQALRPDHDSCASAGRRVACWLLYLRSHWLRMPIGLLAAHLGRKAWRRLSGQDAREAERRQRADAKPEHGRRPRSHQND